MGNADVGSPVVYAQKSGLFTFQAPGGTKQCHHHCQRSELQTQGLLKKISTILERDIKNKEVLKSLGKLWIE